MENHLQQYVKKQIPQQFSRLQFQNLIVSMQIH